MAITLTEKFAPYTDEQFKNESKRSLVTNQDFDWTGAHTIKVYKIQTSEMQDYGRTGPAGDNFSRYGSIADLNASTEELARRKTARSSSTWISWTLTRPSSRLKPLPHWPARIVRSLFRRLTATPTALCVLAQAPSPPQRPLPPKAFTAIFWQRLPRWMMQRFRKLTAC